jgi:PIN domain nuclease of toxin-antitoxin system
MIEAVADTHAVLWLLANDPRLSKRAKEMFLGIAERGNTVGVSAITFAEMVYLVEKQRIGPTQFTDLSRRVDSPDSFLQVIPLDLNVVRYLPQVSASEIPDFPDRIIAATAMALSAPLISRDGKIRASSVQTIW